MHYYQFNIGDYASHTSHLTDIEDLAYRRLLDWCYLHEKPLPNDIEEIARLIRMRSHCDAIANVLREFFKSNDGYISERVLQEINHVSSKSEKAKASANARWSNKIKDLHSDANGMRTHSERNATQDPIHITQDPIPKTHNTRLIKTPPTPQKGDENGFAEFWEMYPKKVGKDAALRLWKKLALSQEIKDQIKDALKWQRVCDQWKKENGQFVPNPSTYLNQGRWQDEQPPPAKLEVYEAPWQKAARLRMAEFAPNVAAKDPNSISTIDMEFFTRPQEIKNVTSNSSD